MSTCTFAHFPQIFVCEKLHLARTHQGSERHTNTLRTKPRHGRTPERDREDECDAGRHESREREQRERPKGVFHDGVPVRKGDQRERGEETEDRRLS